MQIADAWLRDLPQQFQDKKNIEVLIRAFSRQLQEVNDVFATMEELTGIEKACGINLDRLGENVSMTRADAHEVLRKNKSIEISDDTYRSVLKYGILRNTSDCTYDGIMDALHSIWEDANITYTEDPKRPATVILKFDDRSLDDKDSTDGRVLGIKSAGVTLKYSIGYSDVFPLSKTEQFDCGRMGLKVNFPYFSNRTLDGTWLLNGLVNLDVEMVPMYVSPGFRCQINTEETIEAALTIRHASSGESETVDL